MLMAARKNSTHSTRIHRNGATTVCGRPWNVLPITNCRSISWHFLSFLIFRMTVYGHILSKSFRSNKCSHLFLLTCHLLASILTTCYQVTVIHELQQYPMPNLIYLFSSIDWPLLIVYISCSTV